MPIDTSGVGLENKQPGLLAGSITFLVSSLVIYLARFATSIVVARTLGVEGKGAYTLVLLVGGLLPMFFSLGINSAITYLTAGRKFIASHLFLFSLFSSLFLGILGGILFYLAFYGFLSRSFLEGIGNWEIYLVILVLPINLITLFLSSIIFGKQQLSAYNLVNVSRVISNLALQIISSVNQGGVPGAILAWFFSNLIALLVTLWFLRHDYPSQIFYPRPITSPVLSFGVKSYFANLLNLFNYRLDSFLVNYYSGPGNVGLYSVSVSAAELIWYMPNAISSALFPKSSTLERQQAAKLTALACRQTLLVSSLLTLLFALAGPLFIPFIYGVAFQDSVPAFLWLLPGIFSLSLSKIISANLSGAGKPQYATYTSGITLGVTIGLDVALIPYFGINGAAIASSIAYIASAILAVSWFYKETQIPWKEVIFPKITDLTDLVNQTINLLGVYKR